MYAHEFQSIELIESRSLSDSQTGAPCSKLRDNHLRISIVVMIKIHEPNFVAYNFINNNPVSDMAAAITG